MSSKLIRDKILDIIRAKGEALPSHYVAEGNGLVFRLRQKLCEEVVEYLKDPSIEELADIIEVISALAEKAHGLEFERVMFAAMEKRAEKGGFSLGIIADFQKQVTHDDAAPVSSTDQEGGVS